MAKSSESDGVAAAEATGAAMQEVTDAEEADGFRGVRVDETPRENYTVAGVVAGKPTPERSELEKPGS